MWTPLGDPCGDSAPPLPRGCDKDGSQKQTRHCSCPRCLKEVKTGKPQTYPLEEIQTGLPRRIAHLQRVTVILQELFSLTRIYEKTKIPCKVQPGEHLLEPLPPDRNVRFRLAPYPVPESEDQTLPSSPRGRGRERRPGARWDAGAGTVWMGGNPVRAAPSAGSGLPIPGTRRPARRPRLQADTRRAFPSTPCHSEDLCGAATGWPLPRGPRRPSRPPKPSASTVHLEPSLPPAFPGPLLQPAGLPATAPASQNPPVRAASHL